MARAPCSNAWLYPTFVTLSGPLFGGSPLGNLCVGFPQHFMASWTPATSLAGTLLLYLTCYICMRRNTVGNYLCKALCATWHRCKRPQKITSPTWERAPAGMRHVHHRHWDADYRRQNRLRGRISGLAQEIKARTPYYITEFLTAIYSDLMRLYHSAT